MIRKLRDNRRGLTLVRLLIVIALFVILLGLLMPAVPEVRELTARDMSIFHLMNIGMGVANHAALYAGKIPSGYGPFPGKEGEARSFFYWILPAIEQENVYKNEDFQAVINTYIAGTDPTNPGDSNASSYCLNGRALGGETDGPQANYSRTFNIKGTSNTILFFERFAQANGAWGDKTTFLYASKDPGAAIASPIFGIMPGEPGYEPNTGHGYTPSSLLVGLADGSYRTVVPSIRQAHAGTTIWDWALSVTGPKGPEIFGNAPPPADW